MGQRIGEESGEAEVDLGLFPRGTSLHPEEGLEQLVLQPSDEAQER